MNWEEWYEEQQEEGEVEEEAEQDNHVDFDLFSLLSNPKGGKSVVEEQFHAGVSILTMVFQDYYKILEVDHDASEDTIRSNYIRLALRWHPDKRKDQDSATSRFQEINEAYTVLSDPVRRREYDSKGMLYVYDCNLIEYLNRYKGLILTCNGLGMKHSLW